MKPSIETEQKFRISSIKAFKTALRSSGAKKVSTGKQLNEYWDYNGTLKMKRQVLRLRKTGRLAYLTFKGDKLGGIYTRRIEHEIAVNYAGMKKILTAIGFSVRYAYRKFRDEYRLGNGLIMIDRLPGQGWFIELEGTTKWIQKAAKKLNLSDSDREEKSYLEILFPQDFAGSSSRKKRQ